MKKILQMTPERESAMIEFREQYRAIGLSTEPADRKTTEETITEMYAKMGKKQPIYLWFDGQATSLLAINLLQNQGAANLGANLRDNLWANLRANLRANLGDNLWANLGANLGANLWDNLGANLRDNLGANLGANLWANLRDNLGANLRDNLWANLGANLGANLWANLFWGQMEAYWIAYYIFPHKHIRNMHTEKQIATLNLWDKLAKSCCWWWPYQNVCICSERPLEIHMQSARLHRDGEPAFVSRDGWKMWYLNGIEVPQKIAETPADQLDPKLALSGNVDVRREVLRKIGIERALPVLNPSIIHQTTLKDGNGIKHHYELLNIPLDSTMYPYLKMENPSLPKTFHIEGVHEQCRTVEQALAWREGEIDFSGNGNDRHKFVVPEWIH